MKLTTIIVILACTAVLTASATRIKPIFQQPLYEGWEYTFQYEDKNIMAYQDNQSKTYAYSKVRKETQALSDTFKQAGLRQSNLIVAEDNALYSSSIDKKTLHKIEITSDFEINILENITNSIQSADQYYISQLQNGLIPFIATFPNPNNQSEHFIVGEVYSIIEKNFTKKFNITAPKNLIPNFETIALNEENFVLLQNYQIYYFTLLIYNFEKNTTYIKQYEQKAEWTSKALLTESNFLTVLAQVNLYYFDLSSPSEFTTIPIQVHKVFINATDYMEAVIEHYYVKSYSYHRIDEATKKSNQLWSVDPRAYLDVEIDLSLVYSVSRKQISMFNNDFFLWLDPKTGQIVDMLDRWNIIHYEFAIAQAYPILAGNYEYTIDSKAITRRKIEDNSFVSVHFFDIIGSYRNASNPRYIKLLGNTVPLAEEEEDQECVLINIDTESGEIDYQPNGYCNGASSLANYISPISENGDAIFQLRRGYPLQIHYNQEGYVLDLCESNGYCFAVGTFDYENQIAIALVSKISTDNIISKVSLRTYNLTDGMKQVENKTLDSNALIVSVDINNVLFAVPGASNLNSHFKIFNMLKQDYIWEAQIPKSNFLTAFVNIIPLGVEIGDNSKVVSGRVFIVDSNQDAFIYDIKADQIEKIELPFGDLSSQAISKHNENSITVQKQQMTGYAVQSVYEFDWSEEEEVMMNLYDEKFLEIFV